MDDGAAVLQDASGRALLEVFQDGRRWFCTDAPGEWHTRAEAKWFVMRHREQVKR